MKHQGEADLTLTQEGRDRIMLKILHELEDEELDLLEAILYEERARSDTLDNLRDRMAAIVNLLKI